MKLKVSTSTEALKDGGSGSKYLYDNGIFDVVINFASLEVTKNGATQMNLNVTYQGQDQVIYGPIILNKEGDEVSVGMGLINKMSVIAGLSDGDELTIEEETHKVGKDNKEQSFNVITDFSGMSCKIRLQREYDMYNNNVTRRIVIRNIFRDDNATAAEIVDGGEIGKQYDKELELSGTSYYKGGVTPEQAEAYEEAQREASKGKPATMATPAATKPANRFLKK